MSERNLNETSLGLTQDKWRRLCLRAFENLPTDTTITMNDVDAILTWCLPEYDQLKSDPDNAPLRLSPTGPGSRSEIAAYVESVIEQRTVPNDDTTAERLAQSITTSVLHRLGAGYPKAVGGAQEREDKA